MTETQAIERCRRGDPSGLKVLFDLHRDKVFRLSWRMLGSPHDAEDAVQEIYLKVFRTLRSYRGDSAFSTWLYRMTANHCLDILRRRKVLSFIGMDKAPEPPSSEDTTVSARRHLSPVVLKALARLPAKQKACLLMCEMEEMSYEEISKALGISLGSVKSSIHRAKNAMKESLESAKATGTRPDWKALHEQLQQQTLQKLAVGKGALSATQLKKFQILQQQMHAHMGHRMGHAGNGAAATPATPPAQN